MELKAFVKIVQKRNKFIGLFSILVGVIFTAFSLLIPQNYLAEGTIFAYPVSNSLQKSEVSNEMNFSRNLIAISNSPEFKSKLVEKDLVSKNFTPLVGVTGNIKLKEISPNILSLSVVSNSREKAISTYKEYFSELNNFSKLLQKGNSSFEISFISDNPIVTQSNYNIYLFLILGLIVGFFVAIFYLYLKEK